MRKTSPIVLAVVAVLAAAPAARAMWADIQLEIITAKADLIVVGEVTVVGEPAEADMKVPDARQPLRGFFRTYKIKVAKVIKEDGQPPKVEGDRVVTVWAQAPAPPAGGPVLHVANGHPTLQAGQKYILVLHKMPDKAGEYYLPSYPKNYRPAAEEELATYTRAARADNWRWGGQADGLQIALVPAQTTVVQSPTAGREARPGMPAGPSAYVPCVVALRNVSEKPVAVSLYPEDRFLKITAASGDKTVSPVPDLYEPLKRMDLAAFGATYVKTLHPKAILFIGPMGPADYGTGLHMPLTAGKWQVRASFTAKRDAIARDATDTETGLVIIKATESLWTGSIESAPAEIEVSPAPALRPIP